MDYDTIAAAFLTPTGNEPAAPSVPRTPARRLRDAVEPIATIGWWSRAAGEAVTELGHGFFDGYVWGRAAALGADVAPAVVVSAFGVFDPALLAPIYEQARTVSSRDEILAARTTGASRGLRDATAGVEHDVIAWAGDELIESCMQLEAGARPLFAALRSLPRPEAGHGRLWRACELVREHRGDGHLAACIAAGLGMAEMNVLTEVWLGYPVGEYSATRGFDVRAIAQAVDRLHGRGWVDSAGALTEAGRAARDDIETATDASQDQLVAALGDGLDRLLATLDQIGAAVLAAHAAPADPRKRAAG